MTPHHPVEETFSRTVLGFWIYLMSDCLLFAAFFTTYAVLHLNTAGGAASKDLFDLSLAFTETMILLLSSVACGLAILSAVKSNHKGVLKWLALTFLLGAAFIFLELREFSQLVQEGNGPDRSAFLSSFFSLVGLHGLHVSCGLLWMGVMIAQVLAMGITALTFKRLVLFSLFWHFLDLVWIFIFTFVYLMGVL